jgi:hypothetical protein
VAVVFLGFWTLFGLWIALVRPFWFAFKVRS